MSSAASRIVIIGAGIGGLTLALQQVLAARGEPTTCTWAAARKRSRSTAAACGYAARRAPSFDADLVVGADGMHSQVRRWITGGDEPRYSAASGFRGLVPIERLPRLPDPGALQFWMGPGAHLLHFPIADGSVINFLAVVEGPGQWTAPAWMAGAEPVHTWRRSPDGTRPSAR